MRCTCSTLGLALSLLLIAGCSSGEDKLPCPPKGIGVEAIAGATIAEQIANYRDYACSEPQICPDVGGRPGSYEITPGGAATEASFRLLNCSTGGAKLEITKVEIYGDQRCFFSNVTDDDIKPSKSIIPGEFTVVRSTYKPTTPGEDHAELRVHSNAQNYPVLKLRACSTAYVSGGAPGAAADAGPSDGGFPDGPVVEPDSGAPAPAECKAQDNQPGCHQ